MRIYWAASLFTQIERKWNRMLATALADIVPDLEVILPQDFKPSGKYNDGRHYGTLFRMCVNGIDRADAVVAVVDGVETHISHKLAYF